MFMLRGKMEIMRRELWFRKSRRIIILQTVLFIDQKEGNRLNSFIFLNAMPFSQVADDPCGGLDYNPGFLFESITTKNVLCPVTVVCSL